MVEEHSLECDLSLKILRSWVDDLQEWGNRWLTFIVDQIVEEMNEIQGNLAFELSLGKSTYADCFRGESRFFRSLNNTPPDLLVAVRINVLKDLDWNFSADVPTAHRCQCKILLAFSRAFLSTLTFSFHSSFSTTELLSSNNLESPNLIWLHSLLESVSCLSEFAFASLHRLTFIEIQWTLEWLLQVFQLFHALTVLLWLKRLTWPWRGIYMVEKLGRRKFLLYGAAWMVSTVPVELHQVRKLTYHLLTSLSVNLLLELLLKLKDKIRPSQAMS